MVMRCRLSARGLTDRTSPTSLTMPVNISDNSAHSRASGNPEPGIRTLCQTALGPRFRGDERIAATARSFRGPLVMFERIGTKFFAAARVQLSGQPVERHALQRLDAT